MTLEEWLPREAMMDHPSLWEICNREVIACHDGDKKWPGTHAHVHSWCEIEGNRAVGWNENPTRGWTFPVIYYAASESPQTIG